jgi:hypothetical protein
VAEARAGGRGARVVRCVAPLVLSPETLNRSVTDWWPYSELGSRSRGFR